MKPSKTAILATALIFLIGHASSELALTVPDRSKNVESLEAEYRIGFINTGPERSLTLQENSSKDLNVSIPDQIRLKEGHPETLPEGDNWYQVAPGEYYEIQYVPFNASISMEADKRKHRFTVSVVDTREASISRPEVSYIRELNFSFNTRSKEIDTGFDGSLWESQENNSVKEQNYSDNDQTKDDKALNNTDSRNESSNQMEPESSGQEVDNVTILLAFGIVFSVAYVLKEVLL